MKRSWSIPGLMVCAALLGAAISLAPADEAAEGLTAPVEALGLWLREQSLSGTGGNLLAWAVILLLSALPLLLLVLPMGRGKLCWEDVLPPLGSLALLGLLYGAVNPGWMASPLSGGWGLAAWGAVCGTALASWAVLRILRGLEGGTLEKLSGVLRALLLACAALLVFAAAARGSGNLLNLWDQGDAAAARQWAETELGFTGTFPGQTGDLIFLTALALLDLIPSLLGAWVLILAAGLAGNLAQDPFGPESVQACQAVAGRCRLALSASLLLALGRNLLQLALFSRLSTLHFSLDLPLVPLLLAAALYLLCRCIQRGRELQADNDSII